MTLHQLSAVRHWHLQHRLQQPLEGHLWDLMLTAWVLGWAGLPAALLLAPQSAPLLCLTLWLMPPLYVRLRRHLHARGVLRCDWLDTLVRR